MRRNSADQEDEIPGGDTFLDVIANLVGILVLLIVCVGVRASQKVATPVAATDPAEVEAAEAEANLALREVMADRRELSKLVEQAQITRNESAIRDQARADIAVYAAKLRAELDAERAKLSEQDRRSFDTSNQLAQARMKLDELARQQVALAASEADAEVTEIEFDSKPIVRERVDDEVLVRLEGDRVSYLPLDELKQAVELSLNGVATNTGGDLSKPARFERLVGPIDGYSLRCLFERSLARSQQGTMLLTQLILARLEPQANVVTESIDDATTSGSTVARRLDRVNPAKTVVTVVVFPDSFDTLPDFEKRLRDRGFRVAKTMQRDGQAITFSPGGRTSVLQ
ncbi:MAG: hypothetical protein ACRCT8_08405 [Lacipirellulaceae bacterium]